MINILEAEKTSRRIQTTAVHQLEDLSNAFTMIGNYYLGERLASLADDLRISVKTMSDAINVDTLKKYVDTPI